MGAGSGVCVWGAAAAEKASPALAVAAVLVLLLLLLLLLLLDELVLGVNVTVPVVCSVVFLKRFLSGYFVMATLA